MPGKIRRRARTSAPRPSPVPLADAMHILQPCLDTTSSSSARSAGGVELALALAGKLPDDLPAAVFIVIHISPSAESVLPPSSAAARTFASHTPATANAS